MNELLIVATADNHLSRRHPRLAPSALEARRARLRDAFGAAVDWALEHDATLFLQAGDLFDSPGPTNADLDFVAGCLRRLHAAGIAVCAVGGNHDTPSGKNVQGGVAPLSPLASLEGLTFFGAPTLGRVALKLDGLSVCVGGLTPPPGQIALDPLEALLSPEGQEVDIFLTHGSIEGHGFPGAREPVLNLSTAARLPNLKLVVTGHIHRHAVERAGRSLLVAPGATEWLTFGETGATPGFVAIHYNAGGVTQVSHVATQAQPRVSLHLDVSSVQGDVHEAARELVARNSSRDTLMKLTVAGAATREQYLALKLRELGEYGVSLNFGFDLDATGLYLREEFAGGVARGVRVSQQEEIAAVADELIAAAPSGEERALLHATRAELLERYS